MGPLIDEPGRVHAERLAFDGRDLLAMSLKERRGLLGKDIAMIFQDPMASLNPCFHRRVPARRDLAGCTRAARARRCVRGALELLKQVEIRTPRAACRPIRTSSPAA